MHSVLASNLLLKQVSFVSFWPAAPLLFEGQKYQGNVNLRFLTRISHLEIPSNILHK